MRFKLTFHDNNKQPTFNDYIYIDANDTTDYTIILKQLIDKLKSYNVDISTESIALLIFGGRSPTESSILLERVN